MNLTEKRRYYVTSTCVYHDSNVHLFWSRDEDSPDLGLYLLTLDEARALMDDLASDGHKEITLHQVEPLASEAEIRYRLRVHTRLWWYGKALGDSHFSANSPDAGFNDKHPGG